MAVPSSQATAATQVLHELTDEEKARLCAFLYHRFKNFFDHSTQFRLKNPQSHLVPYAACNIYGSKYALVVRNMKEMTSALTDEFRSHFDYCMECDASMQPDSDTRFFVPMWLPVPTLFPERYRGKLKQVPPQGFWDHVDRILDTRYLGTLFVSLLLLFVALFILYKVPDEDKIQWARGLWNWLYRK